MYKRIALAIALLLMVSIVSCVAYAADTPSLAPNPDETVTIELPTTPPDTIDDTPITPEQVAEAEQAVEARASSVAREGASIIMNSHRQTVGLPTEWVVAIGVGIATIITIMGIAGGRHGRRR